MSKQVRWQVPFAAQDGTQYRVDIYDEGYTGSPVKLTAGETPFTTDEDDSDDFFAPVRTQSGTLQICTETPRGSTIKLEDILPANNISRPVRLVNLSNSNAVEWQGFLSCEAYSQDYIGIPQNLDLPLIGVLEAMDSVEADPAKLSGLNTVGKTIEKLLDIFIDKAGVSYFSEYYLPNIARGSNIVSKYIDASVLFEQKEYNNENSTTYIVSGLSLQDCLARIATYMGWCLREKSGTLYFMAANETVGYNRVYRTGVVNSQGSIIIKWQGDLSVKSVSTQDIDDLDWMGNGHQRSVSQGAKSVEVVAKIEQNNFSLSIPAFPFGNVSNLEWGNFIKYNSDTFKYIYIQLNYNENAYNNNSYGYYSGRLERTGDHDYTSTYIGKSKKSDFVGRLSLFPRYPLKYIGANPVITGAILIRYAISDEQTSTPELKEALYCPLLPGQNGRDIPIFKMWTLKRYAFFNGKFVIKADMLFNALSRYNSLNQQIMSDVVDGDSLVACPNEKMTLAIKVGNKYWNGTAWTATRSGFQVTLKDNGINAEIAIGDYMSGDVTLEVWGGVTVGGNVNTLYEVIFNSLEVGFEFNQNYMANEHSENHYFRLLGTNFRDEISISTEIASMLNNQPSPSLIMNSTTEAMTELNYGSTQSPDMRRPEVDLLNRLAAYYGAARQRLELEVAHITTPLPQLRLNGINDGKVYLPMAESRDWRTGVCKLTCIESPQ